VLGPKINLDSLRDHPTFLVYWNAGNGSSLYCLRKVSAWDAELADFGLKTVAVHLFGKDQTEDLATIVRTRKIGLPVFDGKWTNRTFIAEYRDFPQALVYDQNGTCTFKGTPFDAETAVRAVVGQALVAKAGIDDPHKSLASLIDAIHSGKAPASQLTKILPLTRAADETLKEQAQTLYNTITAGPRQALQDAEEQANSEAVEAFLKAERLAALYKGTPIGAQAEKLVTKLKQNKAVAAEAKAQTALANVKKIDTELSSRSGSFNKTSDDFQSKNATTIKQLQDAVKQMKKSHPNAKATEEAVVIASDYER
jgi:hypothetical protein